MKIVRIGRFTFQEGIKSELISSDLILYEGEIALEADTQLMKMGDGKTVYKELPYMNRGPQGPKGDKGEKGDTGTSLTISGTVDSEASLPKNPKDGEGYMVQGDLHIAKDGVFVNVGRIKGPKGDTGPQGPAGERGPQGIKGDRGSIGPQGFKGEKGDPLRFSELTEEQKKDIANRVAIEEVAKEYVKNDRITSDLNDTDTGKIVNLTGIKALKDGIDGELKKKAPAETGKGLSTNDFTNDFKATLEELTMSNPPSSDFNSVSKQGIYNGSFTSNCPNGSGKYTLIVCPTDSSTQHRTNYMFQIAIRDNSDSTPYFRQRRGASNWGKWYKFSTNDYTDSDKKKVSDIPSNPKYTDTTYSEATTSNSGLMSASDKKKLDNIKEQVILTESEYNALSTSQKNDASKIYFIKA